VGASRATFRMLVLLTVQRGPDWTVPCNHHTPYSLAMSYDSYPPPSTPPGISLQSNEAIRGEPQKRCASFSCSVCQFVIKRGPRPTVHVLLQSTYSTIIPFLTSFIFIDRPSLTETRVMLSVSLVGGHGTDMNDGGTNSHKFAKDGETSYLAQHPTWIFA
jgi:hypothetical protein